MADEEEVVIRVGDTVSWVSSITKERHVGTVARILEVDGESRYRVRSGRGVILLSPKRITKEMN